MISALGPATLHNFMQHATLCNNATFFPQTILQRFKQDLKTLCKCTNGSKCNYIATYATIFSNIGEWSNATILQLMQLYATILQLMQLYCNNFVCNYMQLCNMQLMQLQQLYGTYATLRNFMQLYATYETMKIMQQCNYMQLMLPCNYMQLYDRQDLLPEIGYATKNENKNENKTKQKLRTCSRTFVTMEEYNDKFQVLKSKSKLLIDLLHKT